jgi:hypothetical protein
MTSLRNVTVLVDLYAIPSPSVNVEPTVATTADLRVNPVRSRSRYTASIPVRCAPSRFDPVILLSRHKTATTKKAAS